MVRICSGNNPEPVESSGDNPGWIYDHKARLVDSNVIVVSGGKVCTAEDGEVQHTENKNQFSLNLSDMTWTRSEVTQSNAVPAHKIE